MMTYKEYLEFVDHTFNSFNWRYGQTIMNVLHAVWPSKYNELVGGEYDCYYDDAKAQVTLNILNSQWINNESTL